MGTVKAFQIADNQLKSIAEVSVNYNVKKDYDLVLENCQHFANAIIKKLGFTVYQEGEIGKVLKKVKEVLHPFDFSLTGIPAFKCRKDLDDYVLINDFNKFSTEKRRVLFCFRNVFDFYAKTKPDEPKYKSSEFVLAYWNELAEKEKFGL